ncbi:MAG TPA: urease accessory protein UreD [Nitrosopumilaceae archaeon]|nr:urease accessory protein UreD [Nitrosopumilaceae archaeon]
MQDVDFFTPDDLPSEILAYDSEVKQLGVGSVGKLGYLSLGLKRDQHSGKTIVQEQSSQVPLLAQRALYYETDLPSMAYLQIVSPSGGILQGDRYRMDISLKDNAVAHLTTQGATRLYKMDSNFATQLVNVTIGENCYLEFIPDQIIPYRNSRFYQKVSFDVHDNASMIYSEIVVPGRTAMNESFEYDICYLKTLAKNQNKIRFVDIAVLEPKKQNLNIFGILGKQTVVGTIYIITKRDYVTELCDEVNSGLQNMVKISLGASILPHDSGILVRIVGNSASDIKDAVYEVVKMTRKKILNAPFTGIRKN